MPGQTPNYQIPYAVLSDPADAQAATKPMADRLDALLGQLSGDKSQLFSGTGPNAPAVILADNPSQALVTGANAVKLGRLVMLNITYNLLKSVSSDSQANLSYDAVVTMGWLVPELRPIVSTMVFATAGRMPVGVQLDSNGRVAMEFTFGAYQAPVVMGGYLLTASFMSLS
jgi:hypothetical protein